MWRPDLGDYLAAAAEVLGVAEEQLERLPRLRWRSRHWPLRSPGFGEEDAYPTLELKAAVLLERLVRNHPLPDGNLRTGFAMTIDFLEQNGRPLGRSGCRGRRGDRQQGRRRPAEQEEIVDWIRRRRAPA